MQLKLAIKLCFGYLICAYLNEGSVMNNERIFSGMFVGIFIAVGLIISTYFWGCMWYKSKFMDRYVTVKGLATKEVKANLAIWEINFHEVGGNIVEVNKRVENSRTQVVAFLKQQGFSEQEIEYKTSKVTDALANPYAPPNTDQNLALRRYVVVSGVRVRSNKVDLVQKATQMVSELLREGVSLNYESADFSPNPSYIFNQLD